MTSFPRTPALLVGLTALATAATTARPAIAATTEVASFRGVTTANVVSLAVSLPGIGALGLGDPVTLRLIGVDGQASDKPTSNAVSTLAGGSVVDTLLGALGQSTTATLANPTPADKAAITVPANPLGLTATVGALSANVTKATVANRSAGTLAKAGLGSLNSLPGAASITVPLQQGIGTAVSAVTGGIAPLTNALGNNLPTVPAIQVPNPLAVVIPGSPTTIGTPPIALGDLATQINGLPTTVNALLTQIFNGPLVDLTAVTASQANTPTALSGITSTATSRVGGASLLGGLIQVSGIGSTATAIATGKPGSAKATSDASLVTAKVSTGAGSALGDVLNLVVNSQGLVATVLQNTSLGQAAHDAAVQLGQQLDALVAQLNQLLAVLGLKIAQSTTNTSTTPDGKHAEAHASGALVSLTLPTMTTPTVLLRLGAADAVADYALTPVTPTSAVAPASTSTVKGSSVTPAKKLAYTGLGSGLTLVGGALLAGGGLLALRRRRIA